MDKIKAELTAITEKYKRDFETEINGDKLFETIPDITTLSDEYEFKLETELFNTLSLKSEYIDIINRPVLTEFIRSRLIEFRKYALAFLLP